MDIPDRQDLSRRNYLRGLVATGGTAALAACVEAAPGDSLELVVNSPPQIARHRGYETAFFEMESMAFEVPE